MSPLSRYIRHVIEAAAAWTACIVFGLLPLDVASALGGWLGRCLGPILKGNHVALHNLALAMPELSPDERQKVVRDMWDNLGRVLAELPHLGRLDRAGQERIEITGADHAAEALARGKGVLFLSGHLGNWELSTLAARKQGADIAVVYRPPNNSLVEGLVRRMRRAGASWQIPKGSAGLRELVSILGKGGTVGLLVDQKVSAGIPVPFFGRPAWTAPAPAALALRFDCPIILARVERLNGARFRVTVLPPLDLPRTGDTAADVLAIMTRINATLEGWIRERPSQWLWLHRRWPESGKRNKG
ncbi:MAG: lauroyl acyltransferase [Pseudomonadota bacterium]|nr:lauroyl acyltransferase [Pseudomonadota bacterium]